MSSLRSAATLAFAALVAAGGLAEARAQVAGHASPPEVSAAAPAATDDQAFIIDFLEKGYLQAWFAHPSSVRQHFADPIENYWGRRNVGLNEIVREKLGYARKWTFRFYRLKPETVRLVPAAGRAVM